MIYKKIYLKIISNFFLIFKLIYLLSIMFFEKIFII